MKESIYIYTKLRKEILKAAKHTIFGIANSNSWRMFAMFLWNGIHEINAQLDFLKRALLQGESALCSTSENTNKTFLAV